LSYTDRSRRHRSLSFARATLTTELAHALGLGQLQRSHSSLTLAFHTRDVEQT
jgi:hypothetical protein